MLEANLAAALNRIGVLIGDAPGSVRPLLSPLAPIPRGPEQIATGIPAETISQRPDVRASERALAAAKARIGAARSEEDTSELQSLMSISHAVFCVATKNECNT